MRNARISQASLLASVILVSACATRAASPPAPPPGPDTGLVLALDFEGGAAGSAQIHGAQKVPGRHGDGLSFDGDDWLDTGLAQDPSHRSFALWARAAKVPQKDVIPFGTMNVESRLYVGFPPEDNTIGLGNGGTSYYGKGVGFTLDTEWHHFAITRPPGRCQLYVDGRLLVDAPDGVVGNAGVYYVGAINKFHLERAAMHFFAGVIDDLRIWDRALSPAEVSALAAR